MTIPKPHRSLACLLLVAACGGAPTPGAPEAEPRDQVALAVPDSTPAPAPRPNVVLILADDLGPEGLGCYGGELTPSPHLDRLAADGLRFTDAHTTPLCTPTRVRLMTGRSGPRSYTGFRTLDPSERTFAHLLRDAGYDTCVVGKWQLCGDRGPVASDLPGTRPEEAGFDSWCLWQVEELGSRYADPTLEIDGERLVLEGRYGPDVVVDHALAFLAEPREAPFLLYYPMILPHDPFEPTPRSAEARVEEEPELAATLAAEEPGARDRRRFADMAAYVDHNVGRLLDGLDAAGRTDDTLVLFATDNGSSRHVLVPRGGELAPGTKNSTTEHGTRMPLIARWPGQLEAGASFDGPVDLMDLMPTLVDLAGAALPEDRPIDGVSLAPVWLEGADWSREVLVFDYTPYPEKPDKVSRRWARGFGLKLYATGEVYRTDGDRSERRTVRESERTDADRAALERLREALEALPERAPVKGS